MVVIAAAVAVVAVAVVVVINVIVVVVVIVFVVIVVIVVVFVIAAVAVVVIFAAVVAVVTAAAAVVDPLGKSYPSATDCQPPHTFLKNESVPQGVFPDDSSLHFLHLFAQSEIEKLTFYLGNACFRQHVVVHTIQQSGVTWTKLASHYGR